MDIVASHRVMMPEVIKGGSVAERKHGVGFGSLSRTEEVFSSFRLGGTRLRARHPLLSFSTSDSEHAGFEGIDDVGCYSKSLVDHKC